MFRPRNPYKQLVERATDENLTAPVEDLNHHICAGVRGQGEPGAHAAVQALSRRLQHPSANVQILSLALAEALSRLVPPPVIYPDLSSRAFCNLLRHMVHDRTTVHDVVRRRILTLVKTWATDMTLSAQNAWGNGAGALMKETYQQLQREGYDFENTQAHPPTGAGDRYQEELQRALALSLLDQGGSSSGASLAPVAPLTAQDKHPPAPIKDPVRGTRAPVRAPTHAPPPTDFVPPKPPAGPTIKRARALHNFTPSESGELGLRAGDQIRVLNTAYQHWWRAELRGEIGIVPVNHLEVIPSLSPEEEARAAAEEAKVFAVADQLDALVAKLERAQEAVLQKRVQSKVAEDEEVQDLYTQAIAASPQVGAMVVKYQAQLADLREINDKFSQARARYDRMTMVSTGTSSPARSPGPATGGDTRASFRTAATHEQARPAAAPALKGSPPGGSSGALSASLTVAPAFTVIAPASSGRPELPTVPAMAAAPATAAVPTATAPGASGTGPPLPPPPPQPQPPQGLDPSSLQYAQWWYAQFAVPPAVRARAGQVPASTAL